MPVTVWLKCVYCRNRWSVEPSDETKKKDFYPICPKCMGPGVAIRAEAKPGIVVKREGEMA